MTIAHSGGWPHPLLLEVHGPQCPCRGAGQEKGKKTDVLGLGVGSVRRERKGGCK